MRLHFSCLLAHCQVLPTEGNERLKEEGTSLIPVYFLQRARVSVWRKVPAVLNNGGNSHGSAAVASSQFLLHRSFFFIRVAGAAGITGPVLCRSHALCSELEPQLAGIAYVSRFLLCSLPSAPGVKAASCNCHLLYFRAFFYPFYTKRIFKYTLI